MGAGSVWGRISGVDHEHLGEITETDLRGTKPTCIESDNSHPQVMGEVARPVLEAHALDGSESGGKNESRKLVFIAIRSWCQTGSVQRAGKHTAVRSRDLYRGGGHGSRGCVLYAKPCTSFSVPKIVGLMSLDSVRSG